MKLLRFFIITLLFSPSLLACDNKSAEIKGIEQNKSTNNTVSNTDNVSTNQQYPAIDGDIDEIENNFFVDWEPRVTSTPAKQSQTRFSLPQLNTEKLKTSFYDDMQVEKIEGENINEDLNSFYGLVQYSDNTFIHYSFEKEKDQYFGKLFYVAVPQKPTEAFSNFQKNIIYKMIDVSGADNPPQFFQELLDSPKIINYTECVVQQKQSKYVMVEMIFCEDDDRTDISLYNPELK